jgi:hypothetical protein
MMAGAVQNNGWSSEGTTGATVRTIPVDVAGLPPVDGQGLSAAELADIMNMINNLPAGASLAGDSAPMIGKPWVTYADGGTNEYGYPIINSINSVDGTVVGTSYLPPPVAIAPTMSVGARIEAAANNRKNWGQSRFNRPDLTDRTT